MSRFLVFILLLSLAVGACTEKMPAKDSIEYFELHLNRDMDIREIQQTFGSPDNDIGSGIHIYVYDLNDGTAIWIGYTDRILYARHMDRNQQLLATIL